MSNLTFDDKHRQCALLRTALGSVSGTLDTAQNLINIVDHRPVPSKLSGEVDRIDEKLATARKIIRDAKAAYTEDRKAVAARGSKSVTERKSPFHCPTCGVESNQFSPGAFLTYGNSADRHICPKGHEWPVTQEQKDAYSKRCRAAKSGGSK